jgi:membrane protein insertase Oxa1/YidC/SpoIIIJ
MAIPCAVSMIASFTQTTRTVIALYSAARLFGGVFFGVALALFYRGSRQDVYNILWAVVFGFATLNILSLAARRLEPTRRGLSFGELMAVMVVLLSVFLLGWEMLTLFHVFPIKLKG